MSDDNRPVSEGPFADGGTESLGEPSDSVSGSDVSGGEPPVTESPGVISEPNREFLLEAVRRAPLLRLLQRGPAEASALSASVDMSRSTVHRALNSLEECDVLEKSNEEYELTNMGTFVAEATTRFSTRASTALNLTQFVNSIDMNGHGFPVEYFSDVTITRRKERDPHATIHRIIELFENHEDLRMFSTVISPVYVDVGYREMMDGMQIEAIFEREVLDLMLSEYPEKAHETISTGNFEIYAHDDLPFELFLLEDRIGMAAHNQNGNAEILLECDDPSAIEWAENLYADHLSRADPLRLE